MREKVYYFVFLSQDLLARRLRAISVCTMSSSLEVLDVFYEGEETSFPCVDCGLLTGNFCDGGISIPYDTCFACVRVPTDYPLSRQRTPLCTYCETLSEFCRFCRKQHGCTPFTTRVHWSGVPLSQSRAFTRTVAKDIEARQAAAKSVSRPTTSGGNS